MEYPLALALVDFLPVLAMATGVMLLAPLAGSWAVGGGVLVVTGGALKATWKTIVALGGPDLLWLAKSQFFLFGLGFTLLAWALLRVGATRSPPLWAFAAFALAGIVGAVATGATWPLLVVTTASATILAVRLILLARRSGDSAAMALFCFNILGTYAMGMLAVLPEQTVALQWVEESLNTLIWTAFAVGVWRVTRSPNMSMLVRTRKDPLPQPPPPA